MFLVVLVFFVEGLDFFFIIGVVDGVMVVIVFGVIVGVMMLLCVVKWGYC